MYTLRCKGCNAGPLPVATLKAAYEWAQYHCGTSSAHAVEILQAGSTEEITYFYQGSSWKYEPTSRRYVERGGI